MATTDRIAGLNGSVGFKAPCRAATTAAITLSGEQTIDGVAIVAGDRVLVKNQSSGADNGIYIASAGAWSRALDFNGERDARNGTLVYVTNGTSNGGDVFALTATNPVTVGTTSLSFTAVLSLTTASVYIQTLLDDTTAADARTTLGAASLAANTFTGKQIGKAFDVDAVTDVASASTCDIGAAATGHVRITGTTGISGFGTAAAGIYRRGYFEGIVTLTHSSALKLPGATNITSAADDRFEAMSLGSGNWIVMDYQKANGQPVVAPTVSTSGKIAQVVTTATGAVSTGTTQIPFDDTIPQNSEGTEFLSRAITPTNASSTLIIDVVLYVSSTAITYMNAALFQDSTANALLATSAYADGTGTPIPLTMRHVMTAGTTSSTTFAVRAGPGASATITLNGTGGARRFGGVSNSIITVTEILP